jgi:outer membrane protein assembly factor BamA
MFRRLGLGRSAGVVGAILLLCFSTRGDALPSFADPLADLQQLSGQLKLAEAELPWISVAPFLGRDDKNGMVYGFGAFFFRDAPPQYDVNVYGVSNFNDFNSMTVAHENQLGNRYVFQTQTTVERAFDNWYGEGDATSPENPVKIQMDHVDFMGTARYRLSDRFSVGPLVAYRYFQQLDNPECPAPFGFPEEHSWAVGLMAVEDTRDSLLLPAHGIYASFQARTLPGAWSSLAQDRGLGQAEVDLRKYHSLFRGWVFCSRVAGGDSWGDPGYIWRYRLGGVAQLRGYGDNRFRGSSYWVEQEELRFPVYRIVTGAISADFGDVGDPEPLHPHVSGQAGLRLALPPDWGQRARFEFGWGSDQQTFNIQFGEAF